MHEKYTDLRVDSGMLSFNIENKNFALFTLLTTESHHFPSKGLNKGLRLEKEELWLK
jgi:hypothetical protein